MTTALTGFMLPAQSSRLIGRVPCLRLSFNTSARSNGSLCRRGFFLWPDLRFITENSKGCKSLCVKVPKDADIRSIMQTVRPDFACEGGKALNETGSIVQNMMID